MVVSWISRARGNVHFQKSLDVIGSLFFAGYHWAKYVDANPWLAGFRLTILGLVLVAVAIALGG